LLVVVEDLKVVVALVVTEQTCLEMNRVDLEHPQKQHFQYQHHQDLIQSQSVLEEPDILEIIQLKELVEVIAFLDQ
tara:strand:- start:237 stop:464 length:228 start_codon:yes stop_codon:yes gene_type:complete